MTDIEERGLVLTETEQSYVDMTTKALKENSISCGNVMWQICSYLKGGYHSVKEVSDTIPGACENLLLDLGIEVHWELH